MPAYEVLQAQVAVEEDRIRQEGLLVPSLLEGSVTEDGLVEVRHVQQFATTAPAYHQPGGDPKLWHTNPQTEQFCAMLGIENKVNPGGRDTSA